MTAEQLLEIRRVREQARTGEARELRLAAELSLAEVAGAVGTSAATISRWERGARRPHGGAALRYGRLLEVLGKGSGNA
jgi:DNA-binding transcriptional regulator YiaG